MNQIRLNTNIEMLTNDELKALCDKVCIKAKLSYHNQVYYWLSLDEESAIATAEHKSKYLGFMNSSWLQLSNGNSFRIKAN